MSKIKFNPFKAGSILIALMMMLFEIGKIENNKELLPSEKKKKIDELEFEPSAEEKDENALAYYEKHQKIANEGESTDYPRLSVFRGNKKAAILWAVTPNDWEKEKSAKIEVGIINSFGNLLDKEVAEKALVKISAGLSNHNEAVMLFNEMLEHKPNYILDTIQSSEAVQKSMVKAMKEAAKKAKGKEEAGAAPALEEDKE